MSETQRALLNKYLDGCCTPAELDRIKTMLDEPGVYEMLHELMKERASEYDEALPDEALTDKVPLWEQQVVKRIEATEENRASNRSKIFSHRYLFLRHAAVWTGILLVGTFIIRQYVRVQRDKGETVYVEQTNNAHLPVRYVLPDSSIVYLGAGSRISYPKHFMASGSREITLTGEAFFEVKHDVSKSFIVHTGSLDTKDIGTSFKIDAYDHYPVVVSVAEGEVGVSAVTKEASQELATLTPGQKLTYHEADHSFQKGIVDVAGVRQWVTGDLVFDEQPLGLVMLELEKRYDIRASFSDAETADYRISGSFQKGQDIRSVIEMLSIIGKFRYEYKNNQSLIIIK